MYLVAAKHFGKIGTVLMALGFTSYLVSFRVFNVFGVASITIASILLLIAFNQLGKITEKITIFTNYFKGFSIAILGFVFHCVILHSIELYSMNKPALINFISKGWLFSSILAVALYSIFSTICIISSTFYRKSYNLIGEYFKNNWFKRMGNFLFYGSVLLNIGWGAILLISLLITLPEDILEMTLIFWLFYSSFLYLLIFTSNILLAIAFFSLPDTIEKQGV